MRRPWIALAAALAACGGSVASSGDEPAPAPTPRSTVPRVGSLPATIPATAPVATEPLVVITRPVTATGEVAELVGDQVAGNRLLMIGDSIFAGAESRYGGELCAGLEPLGWAVEVAAEAGRFVEFGVEVARRLVPAPDTAATVESLEPETSDVADTATDSTTTTTTTELLPAGDDDWDAAAVFLGSNYNGNKKNFDAKMRTILDRLAPRPTLLYTVTEFRTNYADVTEVIEGLVKDYPNVTLIDWASAAKTPGVLRPDGLHPNDAGEQVLVDLTAAALGDAPAGEADCIRSRYRDDSAIKEGNGTPNTGGSTTGGSTSGGSSSTSGGGSSTSGGSTSTTSGGGRTTTTVRTTTGGGGSTTTTVRTTTGGTTGGTTSGGNPTTTVGSTSGGTTSGGSGTPTTVGSTTGGGGTPTTVGSTTGGSTTGGSTSGGSGTTAPPTTAAGGSGGTTTPP